MGAMEASAEHLFHESNRLLAARNFGRAEACLRQALALEPQLPEVHANLAWLLASLGRDAEAEASYRRALTLDPTRPQVLLNCGAFLAQRKRFTEAEDCYRRALAAEPATPAEAAQAWSNMGALYAQMARYEQAEACCRKALALDAGYAKAHINLGYLCLRRGALEEGWAQQQWRSLPYAMDRLVDAPRWSGQPLRGKSLLIGPECGHGDMIQFCRYARVLKERGAQRIGLIVHPALKTLLAAVDGVDEVLGFEDSVEREDWDYWAPILSLPFHCQTRLDSIPAALPYVRADAARVARWRDALPRERLRVGLVWRGNAQFANDAERSIHAIEVLAPLGGLPGVRLVSLQLGHPADEAALMRGPLQLARPAGRIEDFSDTAAIVASLDLVISVDTAVAHLAGAMGKPCWVLLPQHMPDWRWLDQRTDSPWYPGVLRLFRQTVRGQWSPVIAELRRALQAFAREQGAAQDAVLPSARS